MSSFVLNQNELWSPVFTGRFDLTGSTVSCVLLVDFVAEVVAVNSSIPTLDNLLGGDKRKEAKLPRPGSFGDCFTFALPNILNEMMLCCDQSSGQGWYDYL